MGFGEVEVNSDASGALAGALKGNVVVIVDVIDMSTTLEAALEAGAVGIFGASPDHTSAPVFVNPFKIGYLVGSMARKDHRGVVVVTEPRVATELERKHLASRTLSGLCSAGCHDAEIVPNLGAETVKITDFNDKLVIAVTMAGGVAFDAAFNGGGTVTVATVARTRGMKSKESAIKGARRAVSLANQKNCGISVIAASRNSLEDVLAAQYIAKCIEKTFPQS